MIVEGVCRIPESEGRWHYNQLRTRHQKHRQQVSPIGPPEWEKRAIGDCGRSTDRDTVPLEAIDGCRLSKQHGRVTAGSTATAKGLLLESRQRDSDTGRN
jgi:hypothetical protein